MREKILLAGEIGQVSGRLIGRLMAKGYDLTCLARRPAHVRAPLRDGVQCVKGDLLDVQSLIHAFQDIHAPFPLVHAMGSGRFFEEANAEVLRTLAEWPSRPVSLASFTLGDLAQ